VQYKGPSIYENIIMQLAKLTALPRPSIWGRRGVEEMGEDESGGGKRHGEKGARRKGRGGQGRAREGRGKKEEREKEERREGRRVPPLLNSHFKHCALVRITSQRREQ